MASFYIFVDSRNKPYASNARFEVDFPNVPDFAENTVSVGLDEVYLVNAVFPIRAGYNAFILNEGGVDFPVVITPGFYTSLSFCTELKTQLEAVGALIYSPTISSTTNYLTISANGNFSLKFNVDRFWKVAGFVDGITTSSSATHTGTMPVRLDGDEFVYLQLNNTSNDNMVPATLGSSSILDSIPIDKGFGNLIYYKANPSNNFTVMRADNTKTIRIEILDPYGDPWPLPDNSYVFIKLRCFNNMFGESESS